MPLTSPYGAWKSPIASSVVSASGIRLMDLSTDQCRKEDSLDAKVLSRVYWIEGRPSESGRYVVCSSDGTSPPVSWTPMKMNARTRTHEYGGGNFFVYDGAVYFSNMSDQRLYLQHSATEDPTAITPEGDYFYADGYFSKKHSKAFIVREDHEIVKTGKRKEAENCIVTVDPKTRNVDVVVSGADFYSSPRVSPDGSRLCWIEWNHPDMPWDNTKLCVATLTDAGKILGSPLKLSAKPTVAAGVALAFPMWTNDNKILYVGDQSGFQNLYLTSPTSDGIDEGRNLFPVDEDVGLPPWMFNWSTFDYDCEANAVTFTVPSKKCFMRISLDAPGKPETIATGEWSMSKFPRLTVDGDLAFIGSAPDCLSAVVRISKAELSVLKLSSTTTIPPGYISIPRKISFPTAGDGIAHAYFYPPQNQDFQAPAGTLPPVLVKAHGGPTMCTSGALSLKIQYWTSRGFAVADVDYRGSTGYGRKYQDMLMYNWGVHDVDDCCHVVNYLSEQGLVDANKACIDGGSAGGFTTLACLTFKDTFKAGASHYGVADLGALMSDTHKFESRYLDRLIGKDEESIKSGLSTRSPIHFVDQINCPVAFFQGDEDKVVPPNQSEMMFNAVKQKGLPCSYLLFPGEQHGFRIAENINKSLDGEFYFFSRVFGFKPADAGIEIPIDNSGSL